MSATLAPRPPGGMAAGALISVAVHAALLAALAVAVKWRLPAPQPVAAELWAALPQSAAPPAPAAEVATPAPPVPPEPAAAATKAAERAAAETARAQQAAREADIALERDRQRRAEAQRAARQKAAQEKAAQDRAAREQAARERAERQRLERERAQQQKAEEAGLERQREENLRRLMGQIPAGSGTSAGAAAADAAPSSSYAGRVVQAILPNVVFTGTLAGNPAAVVEVRSGPQGTVIGRRLVSSSGHPDWDEAVLRAIDRTGTLPRDIDGRVPPVIRITFQPRP